MSYSYMGGVSGSLFDEEDEMFFELGAEVVTTSIKPVVHKAKIDRDHPTDVEDEVLLRWIGE